MKTKYIYPIITLGLFVLLHCLLSTKHPTNSWGGSLIFYFFYLPISVISSIALSKIKRNGLRFFLLVIFLIVFIVAFFALFPTIDEFYYFGIKFN
jgi:phosphatidylserine synthase